MQLLEVDMEDKKYTQNDIDERWNSEWAVSKDVPVSTILRDRLFKEAYKVYLQYIPKEKFSLLEIGAWRGRYGLALARDYPVSKVTITDSQDTSVNDIRRLSQELKLNNVTIESAEACALQYEDNAFDVVFADGVIQHIIEYDTAMDEMIRVLKPGGKLIVSAVNTNNPPHSLYKWILKKKGIEYDYGYERTYTPKQMHELFYEHGLVNIDDDGFYFAYGMYRWGYKIKIFKLLSKILNRFIKVLDSVTNRFFSRKYGFEIFSVGTKK